MGRQHQHGSAGTLGGHEQATRPQKRVGRVRRTGSWTLFEIFPASILHGTHECIEAEVGKRGYKSPCYPLDQRNVPEVPWDAGNHVHASGAKQCDVLEVASRMA